VYNILIAVFFSLLLFLFIYSNYKIFTIAKSKREEERVAPTTGTTMDEKRKKRFLKVKNISTSVVWWLPVFSFVPVRKL
jgi:hypothetical protein